MQDNKDESIDNEESSIQTSEHCHKSDVKNSLIVTETEIYARMLFQLLTILYTENMWFKCYRKLAR